MSTNTTITITAAEKEWLPPAARVAELFEEHTDYAISEFDSLDDEPSDLPVQTVVSDGNWTDYFRYVRKFSTDGLAAFAEALTVAFPGTYVEVEEEWDSRDADEAGHTKDVYTAGRKRQTFVSRLVEVNEKGEVVV